METATERYAAQDVTLEGVEMQKGDLVYAALASANRDETVFPNPDQLDIQRQKNRHLAFGQGVHYCVGAPLARMEGQIAFTTLLRRLPNLRLKTPSHSLRWRPSIFLRGLAALPVKF